MLSWWAHRRARNTYTRTSLTPKTPTHTQHKELVPSLLHSPSGPAFPFQCYPGVVEKKVSPLALSMWFPNNRFKQTKPHPCFLFTFHIHTRLHRHNPYHLTHVITKHAVQMRHFPKCPMAFHPKPISKIRENIPMKFGFYRPSHMVFLQCVPLTHSSNSQTVNHYLILQSNDCSITKQWHLAIKFNKNLQLYYRNWLAQ